MSPKGYFRLTALLFAVMALVHVLRLARGWQAVIGGTSIGPWVSLVALVVLAFLAWQGFRLARRS